MRVTKLTRSVMIVTRSKIAIVAIIAILLCSCTPTPTCSPGPTFWPTDIAGPTEWVSCTPTRIELPVLTQMSLQSYPVGKGVAGPGGCPDIPDIVTLLNTLDVDWFYTWHYCLWSLPASIEYVPMVRSIHTSFDAAKAAQLVAHYGPGRYWLVGNEPANQWQDNLAPMQAAIAYGRIMDIIEGADPTARIILGNFTDPSQYFRETWFAQFKTAWLSVWNEDVTTRIVGWGVHAYAHPYSTETQQNAIDRVQRQLAAWKSENTGELWVTEYGNLLREDVETLRQMTAWLAANVDRYAYFYFGDPRGAWSKQSLYMEPWPLPQLTRLGEVYAALGGVIPQATPQVTPRATVTPDVPSVATPDAWQTEVISRLETIEAAVVQ